VKLKLRILLFLLPVLLPCALFADGLIVIPNPPPSGRGHYAFAPMEVVSHHVEVKVLGQIATTTVDQEFRNPNNAVLEGMYIFPIPKDAHIDKFTMEINGQPAEAELLDADKARKIYEDIVRTMRDPALLEYVGQGLFKVRIFPIEARGTKRVRIVYSQLVSATDGLVSYLYPLNTEKFSSTPIKSLSVKVDLETDAPLATVYSPSHKVEIRRDGPNRAVIGFEAANERPDIDFQLYFSEEKKDIALRLLTHRQQDGEGYFLLLASPRVEAGPPAPKDVVFVLDTSGSMAKGKLAQAVKALDFCIENLNAADRFEIIRFSSDAETFFGSLVTADKAHRDKASAFLAKLKPNGGTAISDALAKALAVKGSPDRPLLVVFLTDGIPTVGETREDSIVSATTKATNKPRIFTLGIGSDVNARLLDRMAESTRAFSQSVLATEDLELKLSSFFARLGAPALTDLRIDYPEGAGVSRTLPASLPDLFQGDQLVIAGRFREPAKGQIVLRGKLRGEEREYRLDAEFAGGDRPFVADTWATRRVGWLLDEVRQNGENAELRDEVVELARKFGIVTPYTAYLIVEDEKRKDVTERDRTIPAPAAAPMGGAGGAWNTFQSKVDGEAAVSAGRAQNAMKYADQSGLARGAANREMAASLRSGGLAGDKADALAGLAQNAKLVGGRAFYQNGSQWVDSRAQSLKDPKRIRIQFGSDDYFSLLTEHRETAQWLALGRNVLLTVNNNLYEIYE